MADPPRPDRPITGWTSTQSEDRDPLVVLMVAHQSGDSGAFERLYTLLAGDLRRHFAALVGDDAAHDLVQDTFLELHRARATYLPPLPVRPWVFGVARNVLRRFRRSAWRRRRREAAVAAEEQGGRAEHAPRPGRPEVEEALGTLAAPRREAWVLHHVHGLSFEEIARLLRIPVGAARLRSSRATSALRRFFGIAKGGQR